MTKIQPEVAHHIDFSSASAPKIALDENINTPSAVKVKRSHPQKRQIPLASLEELSPISYSINRT